MLPIIRSRKNQSVIRLMPARIRSAEVMLSLMVSICFSSFSNSNMPSTHSNTEKMISLTCWWTAEINSWVLMYPSRSRIWPWRRPGRIWLAVSRYCSRVMMPLRSRMSPSESLRWLE